MWRQRPVYEDSKLHCNFTCKLFAKQTQLFWYLSFPPFLSLSLSSSLIPLFSPQFVAYLYLRNSIKRFQHYSSTFLSQAGSLSLWLFVSHFHILLARDGKGLLTLIPRFHYLNTLAVITVYLFFFLVVHKSMTTLKSWLRDSKPTRVSDSSVVA